MRAMRSWAIKAGVLGVCGLIGWLLAGKMGWVALGQDDPTSSAHRVIMAVSGAVESVVTADPVCVKDVGQLSLPHEIDREDVRLRSADLIVVQKAVRRIQRFERGTSLQREDGTPVCWTVGLGPAPEGHKLRQGDGRTPEGWYRTSDKPWSQWYAAIAVHYPNAEDATAGRARGRINKSTERSIRKALTQGMKPPQQTPLGGEILIHGGGSVDWTLGCVGMDNEDLDTLRASLPDGMRADVLILP